jgi:hypothetical protein
MVGIELDLGEYKACDRELTLYFDCPVTLEGNGRRMKLQLMSRGGISIFTVPSSPIRPRSALHCPASIEGSQ